MNIAELKREKTVKTLAKRLLAEPSKKTRKTTNAEMEAALLRLNPQLNQIRELKEGTPTLFLANSPLMAMSHLRRHAA